MEVLCGSNEAASEVAQRMASALGGVFALRESEFWGEYWLWTEPGMEIKVVTQPDMEGEMVEEDFPGYRTLIYFEGSDAGYADERISRATAMVDVLRREADEK